MDISCCNRCPCRVIPQMPPSEGHYKWGLTTPSGDGPVRDLGVGWLEVCAVEVDSPLNKASLTSLCLLISFTLGGLSSQIGLLVSPIADSFGLTNTAAASQFSWLTGGILAGNLLAAPALRLFNIKHVVISCYAVLIACSIGLHLTFAFQLVPWLFAAIGLAAGVGVCAASTIIAQIWQAKKRQSLLVAQDAFFNSGGMAFPAAVGFLLAHHLAWSWGFLNVAAVGAVIVLLAAVSRFDEADQSQAQGSSAADWPLGLMVAGASLFLIIVCFVTITVWLPTYIENTFGATTGESAAVIARIFFTALVGSLIFTFVVMKVSIRWFIAVVVTTGSVCAFSFVNVSSLQALTMVAYTYGLAIAAVYHSFIAWGLSYTEQPSYKHVTFLYVCPGIGGTIAPFASSRIVERFGIPAAFIVCACLYGVVLAMVVMLGADATRRARSDA